MNSNNLNCKTKAEKSRKPILENHQTETEKSEDRIGEIMKTGTVES